MLKDEIEKKNYQLKKDKKKKLESIELTRQIYNICYETELTTYKVNHNK
jgi:hypothetical protein